MNRDEFTWEAFAALCGMSGAEQQGPADPLPEGFDPTALAPFACLWCANDGQVEPSFAAVVQDKNGGCWLVTGSHDYTGWDCQGGWSVDAGPVRPEVALGELFVAENMREWGAGAWASAQDRVRR